MNWQAWLLLLDDSGPSSGIDPMVIILALAGALSTVAGLLYKTERDARKAAESKLEKFHEIAPDLAENVRWLMEDAIEQRDQRLPWPIERPLPRRNQRPTARRR